MRQKLLASAAIILGATIALPAAADITVDGTVDYDKTVTQTETLTKNKSVRIAVIITATGDAAAEANAVTNQRVGRFGTDASSVVSLYASGSFAAARGFDYLAVIDGSIVNNTGVTQVNQDVGNSTNQGNVLSAAAGSLGFFAEANNVAAQHVVGVIVGEVGRAGAPVRIASINNSVNDNTGIAQVNQNAGSFNNQLNSVALGLGFTNGAVALAESSLGQWNTNNAISEFNNARTASMAGSVNSNTGVTMGNQAAGHMSNQANMVSISATVAAPTAGPTLANFTPNF